MANFIKILSGISDVGYYDTTSEYTIEPIFEGGPDFFGTDNQYASVCFNGKIGIINESGKFVVAPEYEEAYYLYNDLFAVRKSINNKDWRFGVINLQGDIVIPFDYKLIERKDSFILCAKEATTNELSRSSKCSLLSFRNGHIYDYENISNKYWFNSELKQIYKGEATETTNNVLIIKESQKEGVINSCGEIVIEPKYTEVHCACNNRFIVRVDTNENDWRFGVIDGSENIIIPFEYEHIDGNGSFYFCHKECEYDRGDCNASQKEKYEFNDRTICLNKHGKEIYSGEAKILSNKMLDVIKNGKHGIINQEGKKIVNFIYDSIWSIDEKIGVAKGNKLGILGNDGELIIDASYTIIEYAHISNRYCRIVASAGYSPHWEQLKESKYIIEHFGKYSAEHPFDTSEENQLIHNVLYHNSQTHFNYDDSTIAILRNEEYSELFNIKEGILPNSKFEEIEILTNHLFAVKKCGLWGVFSTEAQETIVPCEFDRLHFEGGHTILLNKGDLWGAKSLVPLKLQKKGNCNDTDIPLSYFEIKALDPLEHYFSVKGENKLKKEICYTIIDRYGKELDCMNDFVRFCGESLLSDMHYKYYTKDRILSHELTAKKYGFISLQGYISIPYKYDIISDRGDDTFDVCVNKAWGILDISGKEILPIKYSERIPQKYDNLIVEDSKTQRYGIISKDGKEYIPTLYDNIIQNGDIVFVAYGYEQSIDYSSTFWGCMNQEGETIIDVKYNKIELKDNYILAGIEDWHHKSSFNLKIYNIAYDLYSLTGKLIIGGFSNITFEHDKELYILQYGGEWEKRRQNEYHGYNDYEYNEYEATFEEWVYISQNSRWIVLDKHLKSIKLNNNGQRVEFKEGFIGTITYKNDEKIYESNIPLELFSEDKPQFKYNLMIENYYVVRIQDGTKAKHAYIEPIYEDLFFFSSNYFHDMGVAHFRKDKMGKTFEDIIIESDKERLCLITLPVKGVLFAIFEEKDDNHNGKLYDPLLDEDKNYKVQLYDINDSIHTPLIAIEQISKEKLKQYILDGLLQVSINDDVSGWKKVTVPKPHIFDKKFIESISSLESNKHMQLDERHWRSPSKYSDLLEFMMYRPTAVVVAKL